MSALSLERIEAQLAELRELVMSTKLQRALYSVPEAAMLLGVGMTKMRELVKSGLVSTVDLDGHPRVPASEIQRVSRPTAPPKEMARPKTGRSIASFVNAPPAVRPPKGRVKPTQDRAALEKALTERLRKR